MILWYFFVLFCSLSGFLLLLLLFLWWIILTDFCMVNHPYISGIKTTWSWWMIFLMCSWFQSANTLLSIFGYSLSWHPCSLNVYITLDQDLLAFIVSIENSSVILIGLPLYITWPFSFAALYILYFVCLLFWLLCGKGIFWTSLFGVL